MFYRKILLILAVSLSLGGCGGGGGGGGGDEGVTAIQFIGLAELAKMDMEGAQRAKPPTMGALEAF